MALAAVGAATIVVSAYFTWQQRPWRLAAEVNGHKMSMRELALRGEMLIDEAKRSERLMVPKGREREARRHYERTAAKLWIFKEVLLGIARDHKIEVTPEDEKKELDKVTKRLAGRKLTLDEFFKMGPLSETVKRRDFREALLVAKFLETEMRGRVKQPTNLQIEERLAEMRHLQLATARQGEKPRFKANRKTAIDTLRMESYDAELHELFRENFPKANVKCLAFPELESFSNVAPDKSTPKTKE